MKLNSKNELIRLLYKTAQIAEHKSEKMQKHDM